MGPVGLVLAAGGAGVAGIVGLAALAGADLHTMAWMLLFSAGVTGLVAWQASETARAFASEVAAQTRPVREDAPPYADLIEALPDPVLVISGHEPDDFTGRRFILVNAAARETLRLQYDAGLLVTAIRDPDVLEAVDEALFGGVPAEAIYELGGAQERVLKAVAKPLGVTADGVRLALLVLRDETDARRAERTRADFLANASHELRTPLASIIGYVETLADEAGEDPDIRARFLRIVLDEAKRIERLVEDLMSLSRIEADKFRPPSDTVDLGELIDDVAAALAGAHNGRGRDITLHVTPGLPMLTGDAVQLSQLLHNLIGNAMKYGRPGTPIRVEAAPAAAGMVRLVVADQGDGIAADHLPRLTERFYRVDAGRSRSLGGTGLGLAIVKHVVERHRGRLDIASIVGEGTRVTVMLRAADPAVILS